MKTVIITVAFVWYFIMWNWASKISKKNYRMKKIGELYYQGRFFKKQPDKTRWTAEVYKKTAKMSDEEFKQFIASVIFCGE